MRNGDTEPALIEGFVVKINAEVVEPENRGGHISNYFEVSFDDVIEVQVGASDPNGLPVEYAFGSFAACKAIFFTDGCTGYAGQD